MKILIGLFKTDYKHTPPKSVEESSKVYINENNDVYKFVKSNYEKTNKDEDYILLKDIKFEYQYNKEYDQTKLKTLKESLEKVFNVNFKEKAKVKINNKWVDVRSVIFGWKKIIEEDEIEI